MKLSELAARVGLAPRQIRYMISQKFMPPPTGGRARASYGKEHLEAIVRYMRLKQLGFTPASIRVLLDAKEGAPFPVAEGVTLVVSSDLVASGTDPEPLLQEIRYLLPKILGKDGGMK